MKKNSDSYVYINNQGNEEENSVSIDKSSNIDKVSFPVYAVALSCKQSKGKLDNFRLVFLIHITNNLLKPSFQQHLNLLKKIFHLPSKNPKFHI